MGVNIGAGPGTKLGRVRRHARRKKTGAKKGRRLPPFLLLRGLDQKNRIAPSETVLVLVWSPTAALFSAFSATYSPTRVTAEVRL